EAAGLCEQGNGTSLLDGGPALNPSGGTMSGLTPCACGLTRIIEAVKQLQGEAQGIQIDGADTAMITKILNINPDEIKEGMRVKVVWADKIKGTPKDIKGFEPIGGD
ncbi:unnamed protein product, partial [marine sediment metagenome]